MCTLRSLPWKTHAVLSVVCPLALVFVPFAVHGLGHDDWPWDLFMSPGFYLVAWLVTVPFVWSEVTATRKGDTDAARTSAVVAHSVLALVGTLPVTLHYLFALSDLDPVGVSRVQSAAASYALLLTGYGVATVAVALALPDSRFVDCGTDDTVR